MKSLGSSPGEQARNDHWVRHVVSVALHVGCASHVCVLCSVLVKLDAILDVADVDDIPNIVVRGVVLGGNLMWK